MRPLQSGDAPWRLVCHARRIAVPCALIGCGGLLLAWIGGRDEARGPASPVPVHSTGSGADALARARVLRDGGDITGALGVLEDLAHDSAARADHRRRASYGAARLRLDRGELSALQALGRLVERGLAPHELARIPGAVARAPLPSDAATRTEAARLVERAERALRARADVLDASGRRARRWLESARARRDRALERAHARAATRNAE
ncbi:MAG: hypothetical protein AAFZ87_02890 [Planctomycetota bacterium]